MTDTREVTEYEANALKEILIRALPGSDQNEMTAIAVECAMAVKAAFDALLKEPAST
ncbi:hypothetical protein [Azorhizophilus paspali]|uniref:hypothetical protein n=1 Tax=Azorhizophilus paspali TaxID=69963 RepID=UPI003747CABE